LLGQFGDAHSAELGAAAGGQRRVTGHEKVETREGH
jgi:hypothetical protein